MGKNDYVPLNQNIQKYNMQKNNTDQALSGLRITRPSLSQATDFISFSTISILLPHYHSQISPITFTVYVPRSVCMRQCLSTLHNFHSYGKTRCFLRALPNQRLPQQAEKIDLPTEKR